MTTEGDADADGKYTALCNDLCRQVEAAAGGAGFIVIVIEQSDVGVSTHVAVQIKKEVAQYVPDALRSAAERIEAEQRSEEILDWVRGMRAQANANANANDTKKEN